MLANACNLSTRHLLASICPLLLISHFCFAQNSVFVKQAHTRAAFGQTATLGGTIVDESGSYVSDARISVEGGRDPFKRNTMTGPDGAFKIPRLSPGIYIVDVRRQGFAAARISNVALKVRDNLMLWIRLKGGVHESVTLDADALSDQDQQQTRYLSAASPRIRRLAAAAFSP